MKQLLSFLVESTLDGESEALKESVVAMEVFGRTTDFDPKTDSIVRSEVRRLRRLLESYYAAAGASSPLAISIPKGSYSAVFEDRQSDKVENTVEAEEALESEEPLVLGVAGPSLRPSPLPAQEAPLRYGPVLIGGKWPWPNRILVGLIFAMTAGVIALIGLQTGQDSWLLTAQVVPVTSFNKMTLHPSLSPDGSSVAFARNDGNSIVPAYRLYTMALKAGTPSRLTGGAGQEVFPAWSRDGSRIAFLRTSRISGLTLVVAPSTGGPEQQVATIHLKEWLLWSADPFQASSPGPTWSEDGQYLFASDGKGLASGAAIWRFSIRTGERRRITTPTGMSHDFFPAVSPDGKRLTFVRQQSANTKDLFVVDLDAPQLQEQQITSENQDIDGVTWGENNRTIVFSSNRSGGGYRLWKIDSLTKHIEAISAVGSRIRHPSIASQGKVLAYANVHTNSNLWTLQAPIAGRTLDEGQKVASSAGANEFPSISPDGKLIAWASDRSGAWEIWIARNDGAAPLQFTSFGASRQSRLLGSPRWSPNGRQLAFDARPQGRASIFVGDIATGKVRQLEQNNYEERSPTWSVDGRSIYFNSNRSGTVTIWKRSSDGKEPPVQVTQRQSYCALEAQTAGEGTTVYFLPALTQPGIHRIEQNGSESIVPGTEALYVRRQWDLTREGLQFVGYDQVGVPRLYRYNSRDRVTQLVAPLVKPLLSNRSSLAVNAVTGELLLAQQDEQSSDIFVLKP